MRKWIKRSVVGAIILLVVIQVIRPARTNPSIDPTREITARLSVESSVASIFARSCNDCHSNRTIWPWYSSVAPVSWLVISDVSRGRRHMNLSDWAAIPPQRIARTLDRMCKEVRSGDMPMTVYVPMHPLARLTPSDVDMICRWTDTTRQNLPPGVKTP